MWRPTFRKSTRSTLATALGAASLLFAAMFAPQSRADTFTTSTFTVSTTSDLSSLFITEGSGECVLGSCESLRLVFKITNTTPSGTPFTRYHFQVTPPTFMAGNPSDNFINFHPDNFCVAGVNPGDHCFFLFEFFTTDLTMTAPDFDGSFAVNSTALGIRDENINGGRITISFETTVFDPVQTPLPAALSLFASGLIGLLLLGWRRKKTITQQ
jgi:hypothetical protein